MLAIPDPHVRGGVELRPLESCDAEALFLAIDANRAYLRRWLPWLDQTRSPSDVRAFIEQNVDARRDDRALQLGICVDGGLRGAIGIHLVDWNNRSTSIGYWLDASLRGQGIMTACCSHVVAHLFDKLDLHRIVIRCAVENHRSRAIPERLGFVQEGVLRDAEWLYDHFVNLATYSRLRTD
ncbi:GNAT family N-acetyltransferase [Lacipirellula limnantheis]|uniref:Ribosomal N-acetyltransferase YdaF n=1 Tax=Lacipirellula limnantheis TaxID=2528024 RepID=A0A517U2D3_9BACT|nr:GNAT family protein [Lacipirellula limnantheis]QDT74786.1 Putative ribosomal N-acetyltransferase YdaF [Lacipirellula limnantheis]